MPGSAAAKSEAAARGRYLVLFAACALAVITYIHRVGFANASSSIRESLNLSESQLGDLMAAFMIAYGIWEVPWGLLGDRQGPRRLLPLIIIGGSAVTAAVALVAWLPPTGTLPFLYMLLLRFLLGSFQAGTFPTISRMLTDWMPVTERGSAQGALWMSARLGGALAPLLVVPLILRFGDYRLPLVLLAGLGVVWVLVFALLYRDRHGHVSVMSHAATPWRRMLESPSVWALCLMYGCLGYGGNFYVTLLPDYLKTHRHLEPDTIKWLTMLPFALGVVACLIGGSLSDLIIQRSGSRRWGRRIVGLTGMACASVSMASIPHAEGVAFLGFLVGITFFSNDLAMAPAWASVADHGDATAGTLGGLMNMTGNFAGALGAIVSSRLFAAGYTTLPFTLFALVYLAGVGCWLCVDTSRNLSKTIDPEL